MSNALVVDANSLKQKITERIINSFAELIPEAVFNSMVDETIRMFFEQPRAFNIREERHSYGNNQTVISTPLTTFQVMVWEEVRPLVSTKVKEYFASEKETLTKNLMASFATDMKQPVSYNVALLTHALANASQTKMVQQAMDMMCSNLTNMAYRMHMPDLANVHVHVSPDNGLEINTETATIK